MTGAETLAMYRWAGCDTPSTANFGRAPCDLSPARVSQVAVESSGRVHVLRRGEPPVIVYEPDGAFVRSYGAGDIFGSYGISIDAWDRVWVADQDAHQIVVFDLSGQPILRIGERHRPTWERLSIIRLALPWRRTA